MKKFFRPLSLVAVAIGALLIAWATYQGWCRGWGFDLELGNWDPVYQALAGAASVAVGTYAWYYFGHAEKGMRRRKAILQALRSCAVLALVGCEMAGVLAAVAAFIIFLSLERSGASGLWALGVCACGVVAHRAAAYLLPWAKGEEDQSIERSAAPFDERD